MSWITDILSRWKKPEKSPQATPSRWGARSYGAAATAIADALTPERLISVLKNAENGDILSQCELFEAMETRDGELDGLLNQRKAGVTSCEYEIQPGDDSAPAQKAAEFVEEITRSIPLYRDRIFDLLDAIPKGFSCLEIVWDTSAKQWVPTDLQFKPQRWWTLDEADRNKLLLREDRNWKGIEVNPLNFVQHVHHARSGSLDRAGISLACARPFLIRNYAVKDWLVFAEVFGQPLRLGKLPEGASDDDYDKLVAALKDMGHDAYGVLPYGADVDLSKGGSAAGSGGIFEKLIEVGGRWYAIAVLGQTLTSGGEKGGSYSLGKVQQNVRWDLADADAYRLDETLSRFYAVISHFNFGENVPPPRHKTKVEAPEDLAAGATVVETLTRSGLRIPSSWAYRKFGIPPPEEDEEILEPPAPASPFGQGNSVANDLGGAGLKKKESGMPLRERLARSRAYLGWRS